MKAPAYGLNDAPAAFRRSLKRHLLNSELPTRSVGLRCRASAFDPCLFFAFRDEGQAVGASATHIDDISGCGEPDALEKICHFSEKRFRTMKLQEDSFAHVGIELVQDSNFSATLTQAEFAKNLQPLGTSPQLWAARQKLFSPEDAKQRQCKLGELRWLAAFSRPDILTNPPEGDRCGGGAGWVRAE